MSHYPAYARKDQQLAQQQQQQQQQVIGGVKRNKMGFYKDQPDPAGQMFYQGDQPPSSRAQYYGGGDPGVGQNYYMQRSVSAPANQSNQMPYSSHGSVPASPGRPNPSNMVMMNGSLRTANLPFAHHPQSGQYQQRTNSEAPGISQAYPGPPGQMKSIPESMIPGMSQPRLDFSSFPSLTSAPASMAGHAQTMSMANAFDAADVSSFPQLPTGVIPSRSTFAMASSKPPTSQEEFSMTQDEFPALPGARSSKSPMTSPQSRGGAPPNGVGTIGWAGDSSPHNGASSFHATPAQTPVRQPSSRAAMSPASATIPMVSAIGSQPAGYPQPSISSPGGSQQQQQQQQRPPSAQSLGAASTTSSAADGVDLQERFGMRGLLNVVRQANQDLSMLAMGIDLTTLGLNLNAPDKLYKTLDSPFPKEKTQSFSLPSCYSIKGVPPLLSRMDKLSEEELFYVFYCMPGDKAQLYASQALRARSWRYHKEEQLWITRDPNARPLETGPNFERGIYVYFDTTKWKKAKKEMTLQYDLLEIPATSPASAPSSATSS